MQDFKLSIDNKSDCPSPLFFNVLVYPGKNLTKIKNLISNRDLARQILACPWTHAVTSMTGVMPVFNEVQPKNSISFYLILHNLWAEFVFFALMTLFQSLLLCLSIGPL